MKASQGLEQRPIVDELQYRIAFEKLVTSLSTNFINMALDDIDNGIIRSIQSVCERTGYDRSYVILFSDDRKVVDTIYEWCDEGIEPQHQYTRGRPVDSFPWFRATVQHQAIVQLEDIDLLREEAGLATEETRAKGVRSILILPLSLRGEPVGVLGFDAIRTSRQWPEETTVLLKIVGEIIVNALQRKRGENALRESYQMLEKRVEERTREIERRTQVAEGLRDILQVLNSNRALPEVLDYIVCQACELLDATGTMIRKADTQHNTATTEASYHLPDEFEQIRSTQLYYNANDLILMSHQPVVIPDIQATYRPALEMDEKLDDIQRIYVNALTSYYRSMLSIPLYIKEEIYGSLNFFFKEHREFLEEDIQLAMSLGDQAALAIENARLRAESEQNAIAMERNRLARDLHDAVTQTLFSASLIAEVLPRIFERNPEEGRRRLEELRQLSRGALAEMRTLLLELRPSALIESRLSELLKQLAEAVHGRARLPVHLTVEGDFPLDPDVQVAFYRIAQEALNNTVKHAGASQAWIELKFRQSPETAELRVEVCIRDDGQGFDPDLVSPNHLGLGIMRERAQTIKASLVIESQTGQGTEIRVAWPGDFS